MTQNTPGESQPNATRSQPVACRLDIALDLLIDYLLEDHSDSNVAKPAKRSSRKVRPATAKALCGANPFSSGEERTASGDADSPRSLQQSTNTRGKMEPQ